MVELWLAKELAEVAVIIALFAVIVAFALIVARRGKGLQ